MRRFVSESAHASHTPVYGNMAPKPAYSYDRLSTSNGTSGSLRGAVSRATINRAWLVKLVAGMILVFLSGAAVQSLLTPSAEHVYGLMIDAGSTGSRMHTFTFTRNEDQKLDLITEDFFPVKPGLSAYKEKPIEAARSLDPLLDRARAIVPADKRAITPVFLRATAGLRMTGARTANEILHEVRTRLRSSGFRFDEDGWATILEGSDEGIYSWITVNYLMDRPAESTVGTLEMGGGSAQVAFVPTDNSHAAAGNCSTPADLTMYKGAKVPLYTFSHLHFGLKAARASALKGFSRLDKLQSNPCINAGSGDGLAVEIPFEQGNPNVTMTGTGDFSKCKNLVDSIVTRSALGTCSCSACSYHGASAPHPISEYVAFAFYLERTVALGMSTPLSVADIRVKGEQICAMTVQEITKKYPSVPNGRATDLCLDLALIASHLEYGHGITQASGTKLYVVDKIKGVELGWSLGAMFAEMGRLGIGH